MPGLTDRAAGGALAPEGLAAEAQRNWEASILGQVDRLREELRQRDPAAAARAVAGTLHDRGLVLSYWGRDVDITWPYLDVRWLDSRTPCTPFDTAMLLYHLQASDGTPPAGTWVSYRELPGGAFYHQAFTGYTGRRLASAFGQSPEMFDRAARACAGEVVTGLAPAAWKFLPFERIPLGACLWPGDDELPAQASILFDACAGFHLPTDGLALLGSGLTGRLLRAAREAT
ncbi:MAG TPA: DUF3786 domain-containing protein [Anaerolineales bacterium]|nr:DUF3786 domain-containing protein [Anaerolineales bacterium]